MEVFPSSKNIQTLPSAIFKYFEQLSQLVDFKFSTEFKKKILEQIPIWIFYEF
jgi:hypothetical protein